MIYVLSDPHGVKCAASTKYQVRHWLKANGGVQPTYKITFVRMGYGGNCKTKVFGADDIEEVLNSRVRIKF